MTTPDLTPLIEKDLPEWVALRHTLHAHPELAFAEFATAERVREHLSQLEGLSIREGVGGTGVVAVLGREKPGPAVALRADMDALPMEETTGLPYASTVPGKMHACGHDGHTTALLAAARVLHQIRDTLEHPVVFLFQPAEEGGAGAARMLEDGGLADPRPAAIFGLHNMPLPTLRLGQIAWREGALMAAAGKFTITVRGRGGHAAIPHLNIDPIPIAAQIVTGLQQILSRQTNPLVPTVLSVTEIHAGSAFNVIPENATLRGTFRCLDQIEFASLPDKITRICEQIAAAFHAECRVVFDEEPYPVLVNDRRACHVLREVCTETGRGEDTFDICPPLMASEDFAFYTHQIPGAFFFVGTRPPEVPEVPMCHHPAFDFNDDALPHCIALHCEIARRFPRLWQAAEPGSNQSALTE